MVDLLSEHDLEVLLEVGHTDSATNMQVIGLTHRPTGFNGRRWYFVSTNGERAETLFLVGGFFRTRREAEVRTVVGARSASDTIVKRLALTISDFAVWCANPPNGFVRRELQRHSQRRVRS